MSKEIIYDTDIVQTRKRRSTSASRMYTFVMRHSGGMITTQRQVDIVLLGFIALSFIIIFTQINQVLTPPEPVPVPPLGAGSGSR